MNILLFLLASMFTACNANKEISLIKKPIIPINLTDTQNPSPIILPRLDEAFGEGGSDFAQQNRIEGRTANQATRTLYATVYVFDESGDYCLMHWHKKFAHWMPPGGKIDIGERPEQTVVRECKEETGIDIQVVGACYNSPTTPNIVQPFGLEYYSYGGMDMRRSFGYAETEAFDFIYLATADKNQIITIQQGESAKVIWTSVDEIIKTEYKAFDRIKKWVQHLQGQYLLYRITLHKRR